MSDVKSFEKKDIKNVDSLLEDLFCSFFFVVLF